MGKNRQFLTSKTKHTNNLLRLNTEHTDCYEIEHTNLSCVQKVPYRIFLTLKTDNTEQTEHTDAFLQTFFVLFSTRLYNHFFKIELWSLENKRPR